MSFNSAAAIKNTNKFTEAKRVSVSFEAEQETTLMSILSQYGIKFVIQCPRKSSETCQFMDIKEVIIEGKSYNFADYVEHLIYVSGKSLNENQVHYMKYNKRNHTAATNNSLIDMLEQLGWKIVLKNTKDSSITLKMSRISVLSFGATVISGEDIARVGSLLNKELKSVVHGHKRDTSLMISENELPLCNFMNFTMPNEFNLLSLHRMLQPISISSHVGSINDINAQECVVRPSCVGDVRRDDDDMTGLVVERTKAETIKDDARSQRQIDEIEVEEAEIKEEANEAAANEEETLSLFGNGLPPMPIVSQQQQPCSYYCYNPQDGCWYSIISNNNNNNVDNGMDNVMNGCFDFVLRQVNTLVEGVNNLHCSNDCENGFIQTSAYNPSV